MIRPDRKSLMEKIIKLAGLPAGKETAGYFTRRQLMELRLHLEGMQELLKIKQGNHAESQT